MGLDSRPVTGGGGCAHCLWGRVGTGALAIGGPADTVDVVDLDALSPDLQATLETGGDLFRLGAAVSALLEPLRGSTIDLGVGHTLVLARVPYPGGRYGLRLTPGVEGVYAWLSSPEPPGFNENVRLDPQSPDLGFAGDDGGQAWAMYPHLFAAGMDSWGDLNEPLGPRADAGVCAWQEATDLAGAWNATLGRNATERTLRALLCLYAVAERRIGGPLFGALEEGRGEALRQGHRKFAQSTQAASLLLLAVSDLREDAWQVARSLLPGFTGTPGELVAIASAATSAPAC